MKIIKTTRKCICHITSFLTLIRRCWLVHAHALFNKNYRKKKVDTRVPFLRGIACTQKDCLDDQSTFRVCATSLFVSTASCHGWIMLAISYPDSLVSFAHAQQNQRFDFVRRARETSKGLGTRLECWQRECYLPALADTEEQRKVKAFYCTSISYQPFLYLFLLFIEKVFCRNSFNPFTPQSDQFAASPEILHQSEELGYS